MKLSLPYGPMITKQNTKFRLKPFEDMLNSFIATIIVVSPLTRFYLIKFFLQTRALLTKSLRANDYLNCITFRFCQDPYDPENFTNRESVVVMDSFPKVVMLEYCKILKCVTDLSILVISLILFSLFFFLV